MLKPLKWLLSAVLVAALTNCGGSDDTTQEPQYSLSGNVSGLSGSLVIKVNTNNVTLNGNGAANLGSGFTSGTTVELAITTQPAKQNCTITSPNTITFANADISNVAISCIDITHGVSGVASGLGRAISLQYSHDGISQVVQIAENGSFSLSEKFIVGTALNFSVIPTIGHSCSVTPQSFDLIKDLDTLKLDCSTFGKINGQVNEYSSGTPIAGAKIDVYVIGSDNEPSILQTVVSDDAGAFAVVGTGYYERISLRASSNNHVTRSEVVRTSEVNPNAVVSIAMLEVDFSDTFASTIAHEIKDPTTALKISLPANAFVNADGTAYSGQVTAKVTNIDASSDPAIMPGYYIAFDPARGEEMSFESFGAFNAVFLDADGKSLQLSENSTALIRIPLAARAVNPPATIPLIHFKEDTGVWRVEGEATLKTDEEGRLYYAGEVAHFSTWNADYLFESVNISGCALDNETQVPVPGVRLIADGVNYIGRSVAYTNTVGEFSIAVRPNSEVLLSLRDANGQSNTRRVSVGTDHVNLDNCITTDRGAMIVSLTWGANPRDLDTRFRGPTVADSLTERFNIYYGRREVVVEGVTMYLDVDDVTSYGPEILTVPRFPLPGRYVYSVHHYSGSGTIYQSPTRVEVLLNGMSYVFAPSEDADTNGLNDTWMVFEIVVSANGSIELIPLDSYTSLNNNDIPSAVAFTTQIELPVKPLIK